MEGFATVEEALEELRNGKLILVTDDEDRENEGDFICAAEFATTENINFMAMHGKGLICMPMSAEYVKKLHFPQMVENNTDNHETAFTVSVDYVETTTGISAAERSMTAMRCVAEDAKHRLWIGTYSGLNVLDKKTGAIRKIDHPEMNGNSIPQVLITSDERILFATDWGPGLPSNLCLKMTGEIFGLEHGMQGCIVMRRKPGNISDTRG